VMAACSADLVAFGCWTTPVEAVSNRPTAATELDFSLTPFVQRENTGKLA
jgi:hypothetical protein